MNNRIALYSFALALAGVLFGVVGGAARVLELVWPNTPPQLQLALAAVALVLVAYAVYGFAQIAAARQHPDEHETDAAKVLQHILRHSRWAEGEHRRLNFREMVDHLAEFRRAARDDSLRVTGVRRFGGAPEAIDSRYWHGAVIERETAEKLGGVCTKSHARYRENALEFCMLKVRTNDWQRVWPRARFFDRWLTRVIVGLKMTWYALTPDAWTYRWRKWRGTEKWRAQQ